MVDRLHLAVVFSAPTEVAIDDLSLVRVARFAVMLLHELAHPSPEGVRRPLAQSHAMRR